MKKTIQIFAFFLVLFTFLSLASYAQPTVTFTNLKHECDGADNGQVDVTVTAGVAPFTLFILGPTNFIAIPLTLGVPFNASPLPDGFYTVIVQDGSPFDFNGNFTINNITPNISASVTTFQDNLDNTCTAPDGFINITVSGGSGVYNFAWTGPGAFTASTEDISNLPGGGYDLVITDANANCSFILPTVTLTDPVPTLFNISTTDSDLCEGDNLTIDLSGTDNGVTYTVLVNGVPTTTSIVGDGNPNSIVYSGPPALVDADDITVRGSLGLCTPVLMTGTITVIVRTRPVGGNDTDEICGGNALAYNLQNNINTLGNGVAGSTFSWVAADNPDVTGESLAPQATGTINNTLTNISSPASDQVVVYTVTPSGPAPGNCLGTPFTVTVTVYPRPVGVNDTEDLCTGDALNYDLQNNINTLGNGLGGVTFSWVAADNPDVTGESLAPQSTGTINNTLTNISSPATNETVIYTVTPTGPAPGSCVGTPFTVTVTVYPRPIGANDVDDICSGDALSYNLQNNINTLGNGIAGVSFSWVAADNPDVTGESLAPQATGTINNTLINTSSSPATDQVVVYTVTPSGPAPGNCPGTPFTVTVTVYPRPAGVADADDVCTGNALSYGLQNNINTLGNGLGGVSFSWVAADNPDVTGESLAPQTTGTINNTLTNISSPATDELVVYTVTPTGPAPGSCPGTPFTVTVTVYPRPQGGNDVEDVCSGDALGYDLQNNVNTLGNGVAGVTFSWVATDNPDVTGESLAPQIGGTINNTLTNISSPTTDEVVVYTVTPTGPVPGSCVGTPFTVTVTVYPRPQGGNDTEDVCSGDVLNYNLQNNINTLGNGVSGVTFSWVAADNPDVTGESLAPQATGTINNTLTNISSPATNQVVVYTVTPTGPAPGSCAGTPFTVTVTVYPQPIGGNDVDDVCSGDALSYNLQNNINTLGNGVAGVTFSWVAADNPDVTGESLAPQSTGTINNTLTNTSSPLTDQVVVYTVTPTGPAAGNCAGTPFTVTVTVYPRPQGGNDTEDVCSGDALSYDLQNNINTLGNGIAGVTFSWVAADNPDVTGESLAPQATGTINNTLTNTSSPGTNQLVVYTVTPAGPAPGSCAGTPFTVTVTVYPRPVGGNDTEDVCSGDALSYSLQNNINTLGNGVAGVTFSWVAVDNPDVTGESLAPQTTGTINNTLTNISSPLTDQVVVYTVTPTGPAAGNCAGTPFTVTVTVYPRPLGGNDTEDVCSGDALGYNLQNNINTLGNGVGSVNFSWVAVDNPDVTGESLAPQSGGTINNTLTNTSSPLTDQVVVYTVTPTGPAPGSCPGTPFTVTVTVYPKPLGGNDTDEVCSGFGVSYNLQNNINTLGNGVAGVSFSWVAADNPDVIGESLAPQTTGTINNTLTNTSSPATDQVVVYTVTPTGPLSGSCAGTPFTVTVTVHPIPAGVNDTDQLCSGSTASYDLQNNINTLGNGVANVSFSWIAAANPSVNGENTVAQSGDIINDALVNTTGSDQTVVYTATPTGPGNCSGTPFTVSITVSASATADAGSNQTICSNSVYTLAGSSVGGAASTGAWSITGQPVGGDGVLSSTLQVVDPSLITFQASVIGTYQLTLTTDDPSGACTVATDIVNITVNQPPTLAAGQTKTTCGNLAIGYEILLAPLNQPANTVFNWPDPDGTGPATAGVNVAMGAAGTIHINDIIPNITSGPIVIVYQVTPAVGSCAGTSENVTITVRPNPELLGAQTKTICSGENVNYEILLSPANQPAGTTLSWPDPDGPGPATSRVNVPADPAGTLHITDKLMNGSAVPILVRYSILATSSQGCVALSKDIDIIVNPGAVAEAGASTLMCSGGTLTLSGSSIGGLATTGAWNIVSSPAGGDGQLSSTNPVAAPSAITFTATIAGDYLLRLTTDDPAGACPVVTDDIVITVRSATDPICTGGGGGGGGGNINCTVFTANITESRPTCSGQDDGQISITVTGGTPSPNYVITLYDSVRTNIFTKAVIVAPSVVHVFGQLSPSVNYFYQIDDGTNVCRLPYSLPLQTTVDATVVAGSQQDATCFGAPTGSVIINATGSQTGQYFYSVDGTTWTDFVPGNPGEITDLPPLGTFTVLVGESIGDVCRDTVSVTINNANPAITSTFNITPATCNGADGAVTGISAGGGSGNGYQFSIDAGQNYQAANSFNGLTGGIYTLRVKDGAGCEGDFTANVTFPGFINATIVKSNATCTNGGNSGSITVTINDAGVFQIALSTDQFNQPADNLYQNYNNPSVSFTQLAKGQYFIYMKSNSAACPTRSAPIDVSGIAALSFDIQPRCSGTDLSISLTNLTGEPNTPFEIWVYRKLTNAVMETFPVASIPVTGSIFLDNDDHMFLQTPDEYQIQLVQVNQVILCEIRSSLVDFITPSPLSAQVGEVKESYPDIASGSLEIINISGGLNPYDIRIELDSASSVALPVFETEWELLSANTSQQFAKVYEDIPPGRYTIEVTDSLGCSIQLLARVPMDNDIFIPNVFTPNDDGSNDFFFIRNLATESGDVKLIITNRWGKEVFATSNYQNNWRGEGAADGIYFYQLKISDGDPVTGWVEIIRGQKP